MIKNKSNYACLIKNVMMYEIQITNYVYSKFKLTYQNIYFHILNTFPDKNEMFNIPGQYFDN